MKKSPHPSLLASSALCSSETTLPASYIFFQRHFMCRSVSACMILPPKGSNTVCILLSLICFFFPLSLLSVFLKSYFLFISYFWLHCVFDAAHELSLVAVSGGSSSLWYMGFSLRGLLLLHSTDFRSLGSVVVACRFSYPPA